MHYTLSYIDGNENPNSMPLGSYKSIQECIDWAEENNIDYYLLQITEWDEDHIDHFGIPEIVATVNLQAAFEDEERENLSRYE